MSMNFQELSVRQCFYEGQEIHQQENHTYEYKHFAMYSANAQINELTLLKTICGMINCHGGYIFIGIRQNQANNDIKREVIGYHFNEMDKEKYKMYINTLSKRFYPKVDTSELDLQVKFVPIISSQSKKYLIKIIVKRGLPNFFYSFKYRLSQLDTDVNMFFKRYDCETKQVIDMNEIYNEILERTKNTGSSKTDPLPSSNFNVENLLYESLKQMQNNVVKFKKLQSHKEAQAVQQEEYARLEISELYEVMPLEGEGRSVEERETSGISVINNSKQSLGLFYERNQSGSGSDKRQDSQSILLELQTDSKPALKPYRKTIAKGLSIEDADSFQKTLKQFKKTRTKKNLIRGTPEYIIEFANYDEHLRFVEFLTQHPINNLVYHTE